jgi:pimeloyl-ACP methyl ester carboxylesterase
MNTDALSPIVLVHGGWHGGWCWQRVSPLLREAGHLVLTPTLTGLADRAHVLTRETGLDTHIADIVSLLDYEDLTDVVLVGHSYAGMVITGVTAAVPERIGRLVYLDAFVPEAGKSLLDLLPPERAAFYTEAAEQNGDGWRVPPPPVAALGVDEPADVTRLGSKLTDQPLLSFTQPLPHASGEHPAILRTYIHCTEGPIVSLFAPFANAASKDPTWAYHELANGHDAMITEPDGLAALLLAG